MGESHRRGSNSSPTSDHRDRRARRRRPSAGKGAGALLIRAVFLDVGGTLIHPHPSVGAVYASVARDFGVTADPAVLDERFKSIWNERKKRREPIVKSWWKSVVAETFQGHSFSNPDAFFEQVYAAFADPRSWRVFPDVMGTLAELKARGKRVAVVSNWDERLPILLDLLKLSPFIERRYASYDIGLVKPDPGLFLHALADMGLSPLEALHVGDDEEEDVKAAEAAGIRAYHLRRGQRPLNSRHMSDLTEILVRI